VELCNKNNSKDKNDDELIQKAPPSLSNIKSAKNLLKKFESENVENLKNNNKIIMYNKSK